MRRTKKIKRHLQAGQRALEQLCGTQKWFPCESKGKSSDYPAMQGWHGSSQDRGKHSCAKHWWLAERYVWESKISPFLMQRAKASSGPSTYPCPMDTQALTFFPDTVPLPPACPLSLFYVSPTDTVPLSLPWPLLSVLSSTPWRCGLSPTDTVLPILSPMFTLSLERFPLWSSFHSGGPPSPVLPKSLTLPLFHLPSHSRCTFPANS